MNPEFEIGRYLAEHPEFTSTPPLLGAIEYRAASGEPLTLAVANVLDAAIGNRLAIRAG